MGNDPRTLGSTAYKAWRGTVILDFGDFTFTRDELDAIRVGLHTKAAARLSNVAKREKMTLRDFRALDMESTFDLPGIGETSLIVLGHILCATFPTFDLDKWIGQPARTIAGAVGAKARKKRTA